MILSLFVLFTGCTNGDYRQSSLELNPQSTQETKQDENKTTSVSAEDDLESVKIEIISVDEAYEIYSSGKDCLFIDVRNEGEYKRSHIKGAILIPVKEIEANLDKIPKDKIIVVYCNGKGCEKSSKNTGSQRVPPGLWCWWTGYI